jgi:nucleotide-binding universal stress UspA family protein
MEPARLLGQPRYTGMEQQMPGIVVGIDGSDNALRALEWAMKEAADRDVPLTVLAVHQVAVNYWSHDPIIYPKDRVAEETARQAAEEAVAATAGRLGEPGPASVAVRVISGNAAHELITASSDADLLVVGSRGHGGFSHLVMGSTSTQVVHHAHCPVVVMPQDG